jgi:hypothetical protein
VNEPFFFMLIKFYFFNWIFPVYNHNCVIYYATQPPNIMKLYISQLIEDLGEAKNNIPERGDIWDVVDMDNKGEVEDFSHIEQYLNGPQVPLSQTVGIDLIQLPPLEKIESYGYDLVEKVYFAIIDLLEAFHYDPVFPDNLPVSLRYKTLRENWDTPVPIMTEGVLGLEFCNYEVSSCPFGEEYCDCKYFAQENDQAEKEEDNDEELPI